MTAPRGSPPMDFPGAPFALADAVSSATLVNVAYDQCQQWINQGCPSRTQFTWTPLTTPVRYTYSVPLFWSYSWLDIQYDEPFGFVAQPANGDTTLALRDTVTDADDIQDAWLEQTVYQLVAGYGNVHASF